MKFNIYCLCCAMLLLPLHHAHAQNSSCMPVTQSTPSFAEYFSWINNTNEGPSEQQTLVNFDFFRWMNASYGMQLDIYAFDAGAVDGAKMYGDIYGERFKKRFPRGFGPIAEEAGELGFCLGLWGGPDGFGNTPQEAERRAGMMKSLVRDYNFRLFKLDAVCGQLRPEKYGCFDKMMTDIREIAPDFIFLNHRLQLGPGTRHSTTYLLGGMETYIDVHMTNDVTAPHHRAKALARELPEGMTRMTEDHGVCLSSCLDGWEDDLVLQAFNRCLIMAPQIYANPWLLADEEFPYLAFLFNLHRDYRDILVDGMKLPEEQYGPEAASRGDGRTRFITLRNLTWQPVTYRVKLDGSTGLAAEGPVRVRMYHPYVYDMGTYCYGEEAEVEVLPFRSALVKVTTAEEKDRVAVSGIPYHIVNDRAGDVAEIRLLGVPGRKYDVRIEKAPEKFRTAMMDGKSSPQLLSGKKVPVKFEGKQESNAEWHRSLGKMTECPVPEDISSVYYATCFAADNNALEVRSLCRSGESEFDAVKNARDAFFGQKLFRDRELWDRYMFDDDPGTAFSASMRWGDQRLHGESSFMLDLGSAAELDSLVIESPDEYSLSPLKSDEGVYLYVSENLVKWEKIVFIAGRSMCADLSGSGRVRYLRFSPCPLRICEVRGYRGGIQLDRSGWRASNLFRPYGGRQCVATQVWKSEFVLDEIADGAYLCVAVNGEYGPEGAWAGFRIDGEYAGCPDRAPSFASNTWEYRTADTGRNYTYYLPLSKDMAGKKIEAFVMSLNPNVHYVDTDRPESGNRMQAVERKLEPEVWLTARCQPFASRTLVLR